MLFNTEMISALLDGRKTVTRRPVKMPLIDPDVGCEIAGCEVDQRIIENCPFGVVGDLLWVRETWRQFDASNECGCSEAPCSCPFDGSPLYFATHDDGESKWKPSIHMPRWANRLTLLITDVRIERVQDITDEQAKKEGMIAIPDKSYIPEDKTSVVVPFMGLWQAMYKNWGANPYVWVIEFDVILDNVDSVLSQFGKAA